jgi:TolB-like protein
MLWAMIRVYRVTSGACEVGGYNIVAAVNEIVDNPAAMVSGSTVTASVAGAARVAICVLPFANMSGEPEQEYFSDGITEDIITDLSKVSALAVTSRNSAFMFKGQHVDVPKVARELNVGHVLEGSVRKAGGRVRITAQLVDVSSNDHVWAERYDRDLNDIFACVLLIHLDEPNAAMDVLEPVLQNVAADYYLKHIKVDPDFIRLGDNPRASRR